MSSSAAAPLQADAVAERSAKERGRHAAVLLALALAELVWLAAIAYGLLAFFT